MIDNKRFQNIEINLLENPKSRHWIECEQRMNEGEWVKTVLEQQTPKGIINWNNVQYYSISYETLSESVP